jgi:hypothetical protein
MKIVINGTAYALTNDQIHIITGVFHGKIEAEYEKLEPTYRLIAKTIARGALSWIEERVKQEAGVDASVLVRPAKKADPVPHLMNLGEKLLTDMMNHVTISFDTTEAGTITGFTVAVTPKGQGQDGGPVDSDGDIGQRENDRLEVSRLDVHEALSGCSSLYLGLKA